MKQALSTTEFTEEFGDMMLNGLDTNGTYIPFRQNKGTGINVAIRPRVFRIAPNVLVFGGTMRVGFTLDEDHNPIKAVVVDLNDAAAVERLKDYCAGFSWLKQNRQRFSTILGVAVAASRYDYEETLETVNVDMVTQFVNRLERQYKKYNGDIGFQYKRKIVQALQAAWVIQMEGMFSEMPQAQKIPSSVVGTQSKLLNQAQDKHADNVISFKDKVAELLAAESAEAVVSGEENAE